MNITYRFLEKTTNQRLLDFEKLLVKKHMFHYSSNNLSSYHLYTERFRKIYVRTIWTEHWKFLIVVSFIPLRSSVKYLAYKEWRWWLRTYKHKTVRSLQVADRPVQGSSREPGHSLYLCPWIYLIYFLMFLLYCHSQQDFSLFYSSTTVNKSVFCPCSCWILIYPV